MCFVFQLYIDCRESVGSAVIIYLLDAAFTVILWFLQDCALMIKIVSTNHYGTLNATSACAAFLRDSDSKDP